MFVTPTDRYTTALATRVGTWDVTETIVSAPGAQAVATNFVATRQMIGPFSSGSAAPLLLPVEETLQTIHDDHDTAEERFLVDDGAGVVWSAYTYTYTRRA